MLLVKTIVKESSIAGVGLFADEPIKKGQCVWEFNPETCLVLTKKQIMLWLDSSKNNEIDIIHYYYLKHGYYEEKRDAVIFCLDNSRFINSIPHPNVHSDHDISVALRNIEKGEEITENYDVYGSSDWYKNLNPVLLKKGCSRKEIIL